MAGTVKYMWRVCVAFVIGNLFVALAGTAWAAPRLDVPVTAAGPVSMETIADRLSYLRDPGSKLNLADLLDESEQFHPINRLEPDFGYTDDRIWLKLPVHNTTENQRDWRLHFRTNFKPYIDVFVVGPDGAVARPLSLRRDSAFFERPIAYPEMVAPLELAPGEVSTIYIAYWSEGTSRLSFTLETPESFAALAIARMSKNFVYYGMMIVLMLAASVAGLLIRQWVFPAYVAYAAGTVLFLAHADGVAFQYLWPGRPLFNSMASVVTGGAFMFFGATYARVFMGTREHNPVLDKLLIFSQAATIAVVAAAFVLDAQAVKQFMVPMALGVILLCIVTALIAARDRFMEIRFYILAWLGAAISSLIMNLRHLTGIDWTQDLEYDSMRIAMVFDALMMGLAIVDRYHQMRKSRQAALQKSLADTQRSLDITSRLGELEQKYALASELATTHSAHVANTIHDLRQPLHALRHKVTHLASDPQKRDAETAKIVEAFDYLEGLISNELETSLDIENIARGKEDEAESTLTVSKILGTIHQMFAADAEAKGLRLVCLSGRHDADIDPLVLMRVICNLVSNAIKYTASGRVLICARKKGDRLSIEVHDTGPGMSHAEFVVASQRSVRLDPGSAESDGHGLGLAIVGELAAKHSLQLHLDRRRKSGTSIGLLVPLKPAQRDRGDPLPMVMSDRVRLG